MIRYEDDCVGCPQGCIHCGRDHAAHYYCDKCGRESNWDDMHRDLDGGMICRDCLFELYPPIGDDDDV